MTILFEKLLENPEKTMTSIIQRVATGPQMSKSISYDEARAAYGKSYSRFWLAPVSEKPPNGESFIELMGRVHKSINEINTRFLDKDIICVAHGGSIRAALALALGIQAEQAIPFTINNLSTTLIDYIHPENGFEGGWRVGGTNIPAT